ncbi:MAG: hypothetical protein KGI08_09935, partial [Thaumarchaeota archaeon]|nr:hypothetical protein [Nitrososphaerota archaeon]
MKILVFAIIASMAIAVIVSISLFTLHENRSPCTFCPMIPSQPLANTSSIQNASTEINQTITSISNIIIPAGAEDPSSGKNYEPRYLVVVLGINNTVKWTNESP